MLFYFLVTTVEGNSYILGTCLVRYMESHLARIHSLALICLVFTREIALQDAGMGYTQGAIKVCSSSDLRADLVKTVD